MRLSPWLPCEIAACSLRSCNKETASALPVVRPPWDLQGHVHTSCMSLTEACEKLGAPGRKCQPKAPGPRADHTCCWSDAGP